MLCSHVCSHHVHRLVATPTNAQQAKTSALGVYLTARDRAKRLGGSRAMPHGASATSVAVWMCQCTRDARKYDKTRKLSIKRVVSTILSSLFNSPEQLIDYRIFFRFEGGYLQLIEKPLPHASRGEACGRHSPQAVRRRGREGQRPPSCYIVKLNNM